jgi:transposase
VARAEQVELEGWQRLMGIHGMTPATAAAVLDVSESTVSRWIGRLPKSAPVSQQTRAPRGGTA